ncbi:MAG: hypothetical protein RMJ59_03705 [Candidatus Nitrosocaldus sp.]|nr:hypothetical protein [Candidatus Nitrosocaldus sp.]MDW8275472.1 hypothetical protein [Candidatus Nitrosocaldus sp.]
MIEGAGSGKGMLGDEAEERARERLLLLRRLLPGLDRPENYMLRARVANYLRQEGLSIDVDSRSIAYMLDDEHLERMLMLTCPDTSAVFRGRYYTFTDGMLQHRGSWDDVRSDIHSFLASHGRKGYALLRALADMDGDDSTMAVIAARASEVYGERINPLNLLIELRDVYNLVYSAEVAEGRRIRRVAWMLLEEVRPLLREVLDRMQHIPRLSTRDAYMEFEYEVRRMDEEFRSHLEHLMEERYEEAMAFGRSLTVGYMLRYLRDLFGSLYFDPLLAIAQQYSLTDSSIMNEKNHSRVMGTGFSIALFGDPGSGKTFAVKDLILGSDGVPAHGLPGMNRYCGGITPAKFIAIGEAYEGRSVNFIVTEFNEWFKYKGMVEPLKIAMERGIIRYETKSYTIRPYRFTSFFSVNYNTTVHGDWGVYEVTVRDPNFRALEDRMLCRLHILTRERYGELARRQSNLMKGLLQESMMHTASMIRDHVTLVYAIQRGNPSINGFKPKPIVVDDKAVDRIRDAVDLMLECMSSGHRVPFSVRLEKKALQLASSLSLLRFFSGSDVIRIDEQALALALRYLVEEAWIRSGSAFDMAGVTSRLSLEM